MPNLRPSSHNRTRSRQTIRNLKADPAFLQPVEPWAGYRADDGQGDDGAPWSPVSVDHKNTSEARP